MTEESFQQCRKVMQSINGLRGYITKAKGEVAKWTKIEDSYRRDMKESQAEGAKKMLDKAMKRLNELREKFAAIKFPESNIKPVKLEISQCEQCGAAVAKGNSYCGECLCEDDSGY